MRGGRSAKCADCDELFHLECAQLRSVPKGEWLCRQCRSSTQSSRTESPAPPVVHTTTTSSGRVVRKIRFLDSYAEEQPLKKRQSKRSLPENGYHDDDDSDDEAAPKKRRRRGWSSAFRSQRTIKMTSGDYSQLFLQEHRL